MRIKFPIFAMLVFFIFLFSAEVSSQSNQSLSLGSADIEKRIHAVENGLKKGILIKGNESKGMNIVERMKYHKVSGVSIALINHGKIEWTKVYNIATDETLTSQTLFQAASISKPFTATIALSLVDKNKITLDQNINEILKTWKIADNQYTEKEKVTLRKLLSHTAGLTVHGFMGYPSTTNEIPSLIQILNGEKPANSPAILVENIRGKDFSYSGGGYLVVQKLIEEITQMKFADLAQEIVFNPLEMKKSNFNLIWPNSKAISIANGHLENGEVVPGYFNIYPESGAAGLWTTSSDLARFAIEIQNSFDGKSNKILPHYLVTQMLTKQANSNFGLGLMVKEINTDTLEFFHNGHNVGYSCLLVGFTHAGVGAVIMTNSDNGISIIQEIIRSIADTYHWPNGYADQYKIVGPVSIDPVIYKNYVGQFVISGPRPSDPIFNFILYTENNKFFITLPFEIPNRNKTFELIPESETTFFTVDGDFEVIFTPGNNNEFTIMEHKAHRVSSQQ